MADLKSRFSLCEKTCNWLKDFQWRERSATTLFQPDKSHRLPWFPRQAHGCHMTNQRLKFHLLQNIRLDVDSRSNLD